MFHFDASEYLHFLWLIPLLTLLYVGTFFVAKKRKRQFADVHLLEKLTPNYSFIRPHLKFAIVLASLALVVVALARPQGNMVQASEKLNGIEVVFCLDVSNSMLATDVQPSRLERCRLLMNNIIDRMNGDKVALVVFAGEAFPQNPLTSDMSAVRMFINTASPKMVSMQGTNLGSAITLANKMFSDNKEVGKAVVLITDGEDHDEGAINAAKESKEMGHQLFVLGVGSPEGAEIFVPGDYTSQEGAGNSPVLTKFNASLCESLAEAGDGEYFHVDGSNTSAELLWSKLRKMKSSSSSDEYSARSEQFQAFLLITFALLFIEMFISETRRSNKKTALGKLSSKIPMLVMALSLFFVSVPQQTAAQNSVWKSVHQGNKAWGRGDAATAGRHYLKALEKDSSSSTAHFNLGNTLLSSGNAADALKEYESALRSTTDKRKRATIHHNMGVVHQNAAGQNPQAKQQHLVQAINEYKESLRNDPTSDDTRYNLVLCQKQLRDEQNKKQNQPSPQQQPKQQKEEKEKEKEKNKEQDETSTEQLLNLARQAEQRAREKVNAARPRRRSMEKNW